MGDQQTYGEVKVDLVNLPTEDVNLAEFQKYAEKLDMAVDRETTGRLFSSLSGGQLLVADLLCD